ncbi:MAG: Hsp20/alpha crystallin family protein, partial [Stackebrandtia sp.]
MLVRYRQPWLLSSRVNTEFDRLMADTFAGRTGSYFPDAEVSAQGNDVVITVDVPGVATEDVDVTLDGRRLTISGQRAETELAEGDRVISRGSRRGGFTRSYTVPVGTTAEQVTASVDNGLLTVRVADATK